MLAAARRRLPRARRGSLASLQPRGPALTLPAPRPRPWPLAGRPQVADERFAELVAIGKLINDWVAPGEAGEAVAGDTLDQEIGVAVEVGAALTKNPRAAVVRQGWRGPWLRPRVCAGCADARCRSLRARAPRRAARGRRDALRKRPLPHRPRRSLRTRRRRRATRATRLLRTTTRRRRPRTRRSGWVAAAAAARQAARGAPRRT